MFFACQIKSCYSQRKGFEEKDFLETVQFYSSVSLQTSSVVYVARHGFACALFLLFFFIIRKQSMKKFARVGFKIAMFKSKLQRICLSVYNQLKAR